MLTREGDYMWTVTNAFLSEPKLPGKRGLVVILEMHQTQNEQESGYWEGELSDDGLDILNGKTWINSTMKSLGKVGLSDMADKCQDLSFNQLIEYIPNINVAIKTLVAKEIPATVKMWTSHKTGKTGYSIKYLGESEFAHKAIDPIEFVKKYKFAHDQSGPAPAATQSAPANPFGEATPF